MKTCRICGGAVSSVDPRGGLNCSRCGALSVEVVPDGETLRDYYETYNSRYSGGGSSSGKNQIHYAEKYLNLVRRHHSGGDLVDIGCANNPFPNLASKVGFRVKAIDYARPSGLEQAVEFEEGHLGSGSLLSPSRRFDVVTAWAVVEHVADPAAAFMSLAGLLKPGGCIHLTTPEHGTWITDRAPGRTRWFYPPEHLHLLTPESVRILAQDHGLRLAEWRHFELNVPRWLAGYGLGAAEAGAGAGIRMLNPGRWVSLRNLRQSVFTGIAYYRLTGGR